MLLVYCSTDEVSMSYMLDLHALKGRAWDARQTKLPCIFLSRGFEEVKASIMRETEGNERDEVVTEGHHPRGLN